MAAKFIPILLNLEQNNPRMIIARELLNDLNEDLDWLKPS